MKWTWSLEAPAEKDLKRLDRQHRVAILDALDSYADELSTQGQPVTANIKKLKGTTGEYRLRVGDYRVRYGLDTQDREADDGDVITEGVVVVYHVRHRREAYRA